MRPAGQNNRPTRRSGRHYVVPNYDRVGIADESSEVGEIVSSLSVTGNVDCHLSKIHHDVKMSMLKLHNDVKNTS